jgi:hypothetical protein
VEVVEQRTSVPLERIYVSLRLLHYLWAFGLNSSSRLDHPRLHYFLLMEFEGLYVVGFQILHT